MRVSTRAARDSAAQKRIVAAAGNLAERFDLLVPDNLAKPTGDLLVRAMKQREVIADLLEVVDEKAAEQAAEIRKLKRAAKRKAKAEAEAKAKAEAEAEKAEEKPEASDGSSE